jgi:hypothetical protein
VAATMAGRCERKRSGWAAGVVCGLAVSLVIISRRRTWRYAGRFEKVQATCWADRRVVIRITSCRMWRARVTCGPSSR